MPALPSVGGSVGTWGTALNEFLRVAHEADGSLKSSVLTLNGQVVSFTRDLTTATGNQSVTGVGFTPKLVIFYASIANTVYWCLGASSADSAYCNPYVIDGTGVDPSFLAENYATAIVLTSSLNNSQLATVDSFDADGFTLSWTKGGSPTGTANIIAICFG
jgi:hypothetical protein